MSELALCAVTYLAVAIRAFQQINVVRGLYWLVVPTSAVFAACDLAIFGAMAALVIEGGSFVTTWLALWIGGAAGSVTSMMIHARIGRSR